jgi:hypothetical protein
MLLLTVATIFVSMVQPSLAIVPQSLKKPLMLNPPFRFCSYQPADPSYSTLAVYTIDGTTRSPNSSINLFGESGLNITITNNMTGSLSGKLQIVQLVPNQTLSGQLLPAPTQSVDFNIKSIYTECIGRLISPFGFSLAPQIRPNQILQFDPPFRSCLVPFNSSTYTITSTSNQTQILKNLPLQSEMKILISSDFINGIVAGKLLIGNNPAVNLNVRALDTTCKTFVL